jgi:hypothetical protein
LWVGFAARANWETPDLELGSWVGFAARADLEKPDSKSVAAWGRRCEPLWRSRRRISNFKQKKKTHPRRYNLLLNFKYRCGRPRVVGWGRRCGPFGEASLRIDGFEI